MAADDPTSTPKPLQLVPRAVGGSAVPTGSGVRQTFAGRPEGEFKVSSCDPRNGIGAPIRFKIHPGYIEQLAAIFHSHKLPYDTPEAIYRDATKRHADYLLGILAEMGESEAVPSIMRHLESVDRVVFEQERMMAFMLSIENTKEMLKKLREFPGGERQAQRVLLELWGKIRQMPPGYWRAVYRKMFSAEFKGQMGRVLQMASLVPVEGGEDDGQSEDDGDSGGGGQD